MPQSAKPVKPANKLQKCPACGYKQLEDNYRTLLQCRRCGHAVAKTFPSAKQLEKIYARDYFFGKEYFDYIADRPALEKNFKKRLKQLSDTYDRNASVIEIGCAYGYFLNLIKDKVASHKGFDVNQEGVDFARRILKVNATTQNFLDAKLSESSIDTVYMWDVIEHLPHPELFIAKISTLLKPGGHVVLTTGDISSLLPRLRKDNWRLIHPPTHLHYFTPQSLERLFKRHGIKVISVRHKGVHRNLGSVLHQLTYNRKAKNKSAIVFEGLTNAAKVTGLHKLNVPLNTGDIMEVVAVKT
ncbi:MAG: class I SAM-dependent methyltransferase [Candidatus Saccharimonadales bacterium]|jgi:2-polyprenyl-3-methyl-5-hydroxy-6-metoxy-1,4-benzoquinol methylase